MHLPRSFNFVIYTYFTIKKTYMHYAAILKTPNVLIFVYRVTDIDTQCRLIFLSNYSQLSVVFPFYQGENHILLSCYFRKHYKCNFNAVNVLTWLLNRNPKCINIQGVLQQIMILMSMYPLYKRNFLYNAGTAFIR